MKYQKRAINLLRFFMDTPLTIYCEPEIAYLTVLTAWLDEVYVNLKSYRNLVHGYAEEQVSFKHYSNLNDWKAAFPDSPALAFMSSFAKKYTPEAFFEWEK